MKSWAENTRFGGQNALGVFSTKSCRSVYHLRSSGLFNQAQKESPQKVGTKHRWIHSNESPHIDQACDQNHGKVLWH
jgi:hypothetical protein